MIKLFIILTLINCSIYSEDIHKAYDFYRANQFQQALNILLSYEKNSLVNDELYNNIGNCYYRINKPGLAIYYYEKALFEDKGNNEAEENILFIKKHLSNQITPLPSFFAYYIVDGVNKYLSINFLSILSLLLLISLLFFIFLILYKKDEKRDKYFKITTIFLSFALFATILILLTGYYYNIVVSKGVIISNTSLYTSPSENSKSKIMIGEGNKFILEDKVNNFIKARFEDGSIGWVKIDVQKQLNNKL